MAKGKDKDDEPDVDDEEPGGGKKKKKILVVVAGLATLGAVYQFVLKSPPDEAMTEGEDAAATEPVDEEPVEGEILELEEMILNIGGNDAAFLRVGLALVLEEGVLASDFEAEAAIAKDVAVQYLSAQSAETLSSAEGRQAAKDELSRLVREAYGDGKVVRVLFTALVMQ
jgi:flagellar basal body-associated protein FliL